MSSGIAGNGVPRSEKGIFFGIFSAMILLLGVISIPVFAGDFGDEDNDSWFWWGEVCGGGGGVFYVCHGPGCPVFRSGTSSPSPSTPQNPFPFPENPFPDPGGPTDNPPREGDGGGGSDGDTPKPDNPDPRKPWQYRKAYGERPCDSKCRGACGGDCAEQAGRVITVTEICSTSTGRVTRTSFLSLGTHEGCRWHDECFDMCLRSEEQGGCNQGVFSACMNGCNLSMSGNENEEWRNSWPSWVHGGGPYDAYIAYEVENSSSYTTSWCDAQARGFNPDIVPDLPPFGEGRDLGGNCEWAKRCNNWQGLISCKWECEK